jgi:hypothetical protein
MGDILSGRAIARALSSIAALGLLGLTTPATAYQGGPHENASAGGRISPASGETHEALSL